MLVTLERCIRTTPTLSSRVGSRHVALADRFLPLTLALTVWGQSAMTGASLAVDRHTNKCRQYPSSTDSAARERHSMEYSVLTSDGHDDHAGGLGARQGVLDAVRDDVVADAQVGAPALAPGRVRRHVPGSTSGV